MNTTEKCEPMNVETYPKGNLTMLLHEELARARMRESQRVAAQQRLARRLATVNRWRKLASWASRRAARASRLV